MAPPDNADADVVSSSEDCGDHVGPKPPQDHGTYVYGAGSSASHALKTAQDDLYVRSEVSATLQEMLSDLETAHCLSAELNHYNAVEALRSRLDASRAALEEERAIREEQEARWAEEAQRRAELGDRFVAELVQLSAKMVELERWKEANREKVEEHGELKDQLEKSEELLRKMKESATAVASAIDADVEGASGAEEKTDELLAEEEERELQAALEASLAEAEKEREARERNRTEDEATILDDSTDKQDASAVAEEEKDDKPEGDAVSLSQTEATKDVTTTTAAEPTVAPSSKEEDRPVLDSMPESALMLIFGYLEAFDILSTAQVNVTLYSRVDTLFGLGGGGGESSAATSKEVDETAVDAAPEEKDVGESVVPTPASGPAPASVDKKSTPPAAPLPAPKPTPTMVAIPPAATAPPTKPAAPAVPPALTPAPAPAPAPALAPAPAPAAAASTAPVARIGSVGGGLTTMFSQLRSKAHQKAPAQQKAPALPPLSDGESIGSTAATASTLTATTGAAAGAGGTRAAAAPAVAAGGVDAPLGLNAAMASSMASKLTAAELNVIISMQAKLRQKDGELGQLQAEKDDLTARLQGVESVKDFLITKVRDVEKLHKDGQDELTKITRQVASDQEVIAFLDGRVQELERTLKGLEHGRAETEEELERLRSQGSQKVRVLSDMLQFEKEQLAESEREWKAQKKVLVKEVKHCRAQIVALQAERDGYYEQNSKLKEALLKLNGGGGGSPGRTNKR